MKIVINAGYGGFGVSPKGMKYIADKLGKPIYFFNNMRGNMEPVSLEEAQTLWNVKMLRVPDPTSIPYDELYKNYCWESRKMERTDPLLIEAVEVLGEEAGSSHSKLKIVEVPDDVKWHIAEYDGWEWVAENHRKWE